MNEFNGYGTLTWSDKKTYEGNWKENKMNGIGKLVWPDGRSYEGNFINDVKEGEGLFIWPDVSKKGKYRSYRGSWKNGK